MIIRVDPGSPTPPYEQIRAQLATMIEAGTLAAGTQLPPIRQLAADLGLATNTVARAAERLRAVYPNGSTNSDADPHTTGR